MLRTRAVEVSLWEAVLPPEVLRLPAELARVDGLLDDPSFFAPFVEFFDPRVGRPSTPMEVYLRMMFLKFRYGLGYESLCAEVADSITWRRFCRIPIDGKVPHPSTLMKLTSRCGSAAVAGCNEALLAKAADAKLLRTNRLRADTQVVSGMNVSDRPCRASNRGRWVLTVTEWSRSSSDDDGTREAGCPPTFPATGRETARSPAVMMLSAARH